MTNDETWRLYTRDVSSRPVLAEDEEAELLARVETGDIDARNTLVEGHLRFALKIAGEYRHHGVPLDVLVSAANTGLLRATETFDRSRGVRFITYAVWWVRRFIREVLRTETRLVRLPANRIRDLQTIRTAARAREAQGVSANAGELAQETGVSEQFVVLALQDDRPASLSTPVGESGATSLLDMIPNPQVSPPDTQLFVDSRNQDIRKSLQKLTPRERDVIERHYGFSGRSPCTLADIAREWSLSRERVRQIHARALRKLRHPKVAKILHAWRD